MGRRRKEARECQRAGIEGGESDSERRSWKEEASGRGAQQGRWACAKSGSGGKRSRGAKRSERGEEGPERVRGKGRRVQGEREKGGRERVAVNW